MIAVRVSDDLEAWAEAEVATGRASSVAEVVEKALASYRQLWEDFRRSLDEAEAEAERDGWLDAEEVFGRLQAELRADIEAEDARTGSSSRL